MAKRLGKGTVELDVKPRIIGNAAVVGKKEGEGPLAKQFDEIFEDTTMGEYSWEKAESLILKNAVQKALNKANVKPDEVNAIFAGDLLNQCMGSSFGLRDFQIPFGGLFGACSTMALSLLISSLAIETGGFECAVAATSSHFCSAEKQFRYPLEYGGQRPPTSQWTVTGSGAAVLKKCDACSNPYIDKVHLGTICDLNITDANNMGAAMAPAAAKTIADFLSDTQTSPSDYDMILTGDLGYVGSELLSQLLIKENHIDIQSVHNDCGMLIFNRNTQDVHAGGSGCGCSASVLCSYILNSMRSGKLGNILFVATGALMSSVSSLQGESIPGIAHAIQIKGEKS
ncbi:MAG: stage V sporulation protein AD [Ruminococcus sp.]|nr:stage V sporulation protein AD [Ruminococcus sp.]MCM1393148.1 stage V sporulation protein AD [Ruminococcus sp.]